jgi:tetratricopeptide (TPR) repeat protein
VQVSAKWQTFDRCAVRVDTEGMRACLDEIERLEPGSNLVQRRRQSLERGDADADDPAMIVYWMNRYWQENRIETAAREAHKRLVSVEDDWKANCILADVALRQANCYPPEYLAVCGHGALALAAWRQTCKNEAIRRLELIPSPLAGRYPIDLGDLRYGFKLRRAVGLDDHSLRMARHNMVLPALKNPEITSQPAGVQLEIFENYVDSFEDIDSFDDLPNFWAGSEKIAQFLLDDHELSSAALVKVGQLLQRQRENLDNLVRRKRLTPEKAKPLDDDLRGRLDEIWKRVRERDPANTDAYVFAAELERRNGNFEAAMSWLETGERVCAEKLRLIHTQFVLLQQVRAPAFALERMEQIAGRNPESEPILHLLAESARAANRGDKVLDFCRRARQLAPGQLLWPDKEEARVHLNQNKYQEAFNLLEKHQQHLDAEALELYVRALILAERFDEVKPLLNQLAALAPRPDEIYPALRAALKAGCFTEAATAARAAVKRFPDYHKNLLLAAGDCHLAAAEPKTDDGEWDLDALRFAVQCYERVQEREPGQNLEVAHALVWLQLKGLKARENADSAAEPLREALRKGTLPISMYETLAAVELSKMHYDEARRLLVQALERRPTIGFVQKPTASLYIHLALAQYYLGNLSEARKAHKAAASLPQSPRVVQEFNQALSLLNGTKP